MKNHDNNYQRFFETIIIFSIIVISIFNISCANKPKNDLILPSQDLSKIDRKPKTVLILGGGSVRGFSHIGALKALEEMKIKPDIIIGVSVGSIIGALYAKNPSALEIEKMSLKIEQKNLIDFRLSTESFVRGERLESFLRDELKLKSFDSLSIPLIAVSTNLKSGRTVYFNQGDLALALRASSSVSGGFAPTQIENEYFTDGEVSDPMPLRIAESLGAELIIAVDISDSLRWGEGDNFLRTAWQGFKILKMNYIDQQIEQSKTPLIYIKPKIERPFEWAIENRKLMIQAGYDSTKSTFGKHYDRK